MYSARQLSIVGAGLASALCVAAAPVVASADTGHVVPVRLNTGSSTKPGYLQAQPHEFAIVHRSDDGVTFIVHDSNLVTGTRYFVAVFNHPENCNPAVEPGKQDPTGAVVAMCDPGVDAGNPATGFGFAVSPRAPGTVTRSDEGNVKIFVPASATGLSNPKGAEIYLVTEASPSEIVIASPGRHSGESDE